MSRTWDAQRTNDMLRSARYTPTAKLFHWLVAVLVIAMIAMGIGRDFMAEGPSKGTVTMVHKATGIVVFVLVACQLVWRLTNPPPAPGAGLPRWQAVLSRVVHAAFYAIFLAMPILGWFGSNALGRPVSMYGLFNLPNLISEDKILGGQIYAVHSVLGFTAAGLVILHVVAALYHRYVRQDDVLARMV